MAQNYNLEPIISTLEKGGIILYPTDTIWGIGCDATNAEAVEAVFALKERDRSKPFVLLVSSIDMLKQYVRYVHPRVETLLAHHTRPLTIIYDKAMNLPPNAAGPDGSVAIRISQDDFCQNLIRAFGKPLVATSANISDEPFPKHFGEISSTVIERVDYVVKYRQMEKDLGQPSVIAKLSEDEELVFFRE
jgi:L-threonylcarbamoyladenylate synthase